MGRQKRKTRDLHGQRAKDFPDKPKATSIDDLGLKDHYRSRVGFLEDFVSDDLPADADQRAQYVNLAGIDSKESLDRSSYLVACHWDWLRSSRPYSVYKLMDLTASSASAASQKRLKRLGSLKSSAGGKVFTSVSSRNRAWIVGLGGSRGDTFIFDTNSKIKGKKFIQGPNLNSAKWSPALATVGDKVYAMCKTPSWVSDPNFPPWFEVLDLSKAEVVDVGGRLQLENCSWIPLPNPPCLPWEFSPIGYGSLPIVILMSYVVVGPYILVSFNEQWGTYAFDTNAQEPYQWHKVHENNLPFVGCATPLGSSFLALSRQNGPIKAYRIHVTASDNDEDNALKMSVTVIPVKHMEQEANVGSHFSSLDNESFCSWSLCVDNHNLTYNPESGDWFPWKAHINLKTYQIENPLDKQEETMLAVNPDIAVSSQQKRTLSIASTTHGFAPFDFGLVSMAVSH